MSWYNTPIQPLDPVVISQQPKPPTRYMRDNFTGTGQNSHVKPPAQDQAMWQSLLNVMPISRGQLEQRWGYTVFASMPGIRNRLSNFESDILNIRSIIAAGPLGVTAFNENGSVYRNSIFAPVSTNGIIRSASSRNYQYFCDGTNAIDPTTHRTGDSLKWDGSTSDGVTNIGISSSDVTVNNSGGGTGGNIFGPNTGTTATDTANASNPWMSPAGIFTNSIVTATTSAVYETITTTVHQPPFGAPPYYTYTITNSHVITDQLQATGFFNSVSGDSVAGVQVALQYKATSNFSANPNYQGQASLYVQILKNGVVTGNIKISGKLVMDGNVHTINLGSPNDLWGTSFSLTDLVQTNFGIQIYAGSIFSSTSTQDGSFTPTINIACPYVTMTVTMNGASGTSSSSGAGVGINGAVSGGDVTLTLGRTYYLVGNTSTIGHFSDLSPVSTSTGPSTNTEFNLFLATYNDPQVDTKYVLATADGGDPSILFETEVLVPGLTISDWSIDGSNNATFNGVYTDSQFGIGDSVIIGGLSHGSYMNNQTLTVASSTPTSFTASFTHAADSATEIGIGGHYSVAIPNGVTYVVDNNTEVDLNLNQPLVFTDTFGREFGLTGNTPPPAGNLLIKHQGRLWMAGITGASHSVYFSKSVTELTLPDGFIAGKYEEAWPGDNYFDVSDGAESVSGLLSDGSSLYIGTQNHVRRLIGNDPVNFQQPQIVHPETGVLNQEVWKLVFMQGAPSGCIWMTPDFRVIQSDFNTYVDVGGPIQNILNNVQSTASTLAHAAFVADGEFELYILAVPLNRADLCDTHLVFDLHTRQWFVWQPANGTFSILFNITQTGAPQWLFISQDTNLYQYNSFATTDNGTVIPVSATTTWMHLGEPTRRKVLNEVQVYGNATMTMSIYGANNLDEFNSPVPVVYNRALRKSPFNVWTLYLFADKTRHRYYQFTFSANNGQVPFLGSYSVSILPMDDI